MKNSRPLPWVKSHDRLKLHMIYQHANRRTSHTLYKHVRLPVEYVSRPVPRARVGVGTLRATVVAIASHALCVTFVSSSSACLRARAASARARAPLAQRGHVALAGGGGEPLSEGGHASAPAPLAPTQMEQPAERSVCLALALEKSAVGASHALMRRTYEGGHQLRRSEAIRGHQRSSEAIRGHPRSSVATRGHPRPPGH